MTLETWMIYVATVLALMSTPGPSQLLILTNSIAHRFRQSLATSAGDLTANALQMLAAGLGLAALIAAKFKGAAKVSIERIGGTFLIGAAVLLGLKSIARQ